MSQSKKAKRKEYSVMNALIDTNIILDVFLDRKQFVEDSKRVFDYVAQEKIVGYITACSLEDIYYISHRDNHSSEECKKIIYKLLELFNIIDVNKEDILNALESGSTDFEDAVIIESAKRNGLDTIITRNISDFKNANLNVLSPAQIK